MARDIPSSRRILAAMTARPPRPPHRRTLRTRAVAYVALVTLAGLAAACGDPAPKPPAAPAAPAPAVPTSKPNVVFIDVSGVRYDTVHPGTGPATALPTFAALAAEGSDFRAVLAPAAWETPSIACVLTGLLPDWTGVKGRARRDRPSLIPVIDTAAEILGAYGYESAGFVTKAAEAAGGVPRTARLDQGFTTWKESANSSETGAAVAEALAGRTVPAGATGPAPLFLFVHLDATLPPLDESSIPKPDELRATYGRAVAATSGALEATVAAVTKHLPGDTLLFVFSDHGEGLFDRGSGPSLGRDGSVTDEQVRVPLVIRGRGFPKAVVAGSCSLVDLVPSVLEAMGLPPLAGLSGRALQPLAANPDNPGLPQFALAWRSNWGSGGRGEQALYAVRSTKAKFVATFSERPPGWTEEIFDLVADPGELAPAPATDPAAHGKEFAERVEALRGFLGGRQTHLTDPIVVPYVAGGGGGAGPTTRGM